MNIKLNNETINLLKTKQSITHVEVTESNYVLTTYNQASNMQPSVAGLFFRCA